MIAPDPAAVARFARDFAGVLGRSLAAGDRAAFAVSGGPDSMAMLALAAAAFPGQVLAATVDHALRAASADEAALVAAWCLGAGVPHTTLPVAAPPAPGDNVQAWARRQRYALLRRWATDAGAASLATAHHADDQAETLLMRAARGSGLAGLSGIRARQEEERLILVRPLLGWRRAELAAIVAASQLPSVDDPGNRDERFDRARFRAWLGAAPWLDVARIAQSARFLAETEADLAALARLFWRERATGADGEVRIDVAGLPRELRRRLALTAIESVLGPGAAPGRAIEPLLDALDAGASATQGAVLASATDEIWHFRLAPPRRSH